MDNEIKDPSLKKVYDMALSNFRHSCDKSTPTEEVETGKQLAYDRVLTFIEMLEREERALDGDVRG